MPRPRPSGRRSRHGAASGRHAAAVAAPSWPSITPADSKDGGARGQKRKPNAELSISRPSGIPGDGSLDLALVLAPLAVLAFLLVVTREARNRRPGT